MLKPNINLKTKHSATRSSISLLTNDDDGCIHPEKVGENMKSDEVGLQEDKQSVELTSKMMCDNELQQQLDCDVTLACSPLDRDDNGD